ncbi:pleckstrin homology domain-containing family A member 1-like [Oculina patagonica]
MPLRDSQGRFCGTLHRKEVDGHWDRCYFVLDEDKCLLRYFSHINAQEEYLDWDDYDGEINIRLITKIEDKSKSEDKSKYDGYIEIQTCNDRVYVRADTKEGTQEWIRTLRKAAVDPSKRKDDPMVREDKIANHSTEADKDSTADKPERVCYETKIVGGVVVRTPVRKLTDSDSEGGSYSSDSLVRSGSAGMTSTLKPIKEGYLTKKGAVVKNWKKRYFKLDSLKLAYYEKNSDKDPIRVIFASEIVAVRQNIGADNTRKHLFEVVTPSRRFLIQGETEEEMKSWVDAITSVSPRGRSSSEPDSKTSQELLKAKFQYAETTAL